MGKRANIADMLAPASAQGTEQIIPTLGWHEQIPATHEQIFALVAFGRIRYVAGYGPNARVYRPVGNVDSKTVRAWLG